MEPLVRVALVGILALALSAGSAQAHVEPSARILQRVEGGIVFSAEFEDAFAVAGPTIRGKGWTVRFDDGAHPDEGPPRIVARGADGAEAVARVCATEPGHFAFDLALPARGSWTLDLALPSGAGARLPFEAYPDHPARVRWAPDADDRGAALRPARLAFAIEDVEPWTDAVLRIERWTNDRARLLGGYDVPLAIEAGGAVAAVAHAFNEPGFYLLYVGSPSRGLEPGDRPPFEFYVDPAAPEGSARAEADPSTSARSVPGPGIALLLAALALASRRR